MSDISNRLRLHALTVATAVALSSMIGAPASAAGRVNLGGLQAPGQFDRFIVKYRDGTALKGNPALMKVALDTAARKQPMLNGQRLGIAHVRRLAVGSDVIKANRKLSRAAAESLMRQIAADPDVEYVEVDKLNKATFTPNDTNFSQQFGFGTGAGGTYATQAWDITSGAGSVVAVLDTGITTHSDLSANILPGYDFIIDTAVSNDGDGRDSNPADPGDWTTGQCGAASNSSWHGTHVAGTIAAVTNNAKGVAGMAYNAKIVPVRVLGTCGGYDSDIADAMIWASGGAVSGVPANANPAEVINLSLGGTGACGATSQAAINSAVSRGTVLVIAAGNDNANVSGSSPANCLNVVAVGATTSTGARSSFSNYGTGVDVAGPGSTIMSTMNAGSTGPGSETYVNYSGTSMATPHVAGIVALMQSVATTPKTPAEIESLLKSTARAFPVAQTQLNGAGIVNAKAAVDAVNGTPPPPPPPTGGTLTNGVAKTGISGATGAYVKYTMVVPAGATGLKLVMSGGTGDADMYVKFGSQPTDSVYDCRPYANGNAETCTIATAQAGTYYINLKGYAAFSGVSLTGSYTAGGGGGCTPSGTVLCSGTQVTLPTVATGGVSSTYSIVVPAGKTSLVVNIASGTGDADLYVKAGSAPTSTSYTCRPYTSSSTETCTISSPAAGTYYMNVRAYAGFSGETLKATIN